jgi:hypothetical protein
MANTFAEKAVKFIPILDKIYKKGSVTAFLDKPNAVFIGTNKIKLPKISVEGAGDYSRSTGYVEGDVSISYSEHTLDYDRGRKFSIDVIDDDETAFDAYRTISQEYVRTKEVPETDAIRFHEIYAKASAGSGTVVASDTLTEALALYDTAEAALIDEEVNLEDLVMWCSSAFYKALKTKLDGSGRIDYNDNNGVIDRRVMFLDGQIPLIVVPKSRFYSAITLYDGTTGGQEAGGYVGTVTTGYELNFILADKNALQGYIKRNANKVISPELNQDKDAWAVYYRQHHDLIIPENATNGIYIHRKATALS